MGSVRWAFPCATWRPCRQEWLLAARLVQPEEKERIGRFVFAHDAKAALAGRLLMRKLIAEKLCVPWNEIRLRRTSKGKPFLANDIVSIYPNYNFNVSHQGDYAVLAAEPELQVGIDIMKTALPVNKKCHTSIQEYYAAATFGKYSVKLCGSVYQGDLVDLVGWIEDGSFSGWSGNLEKLIRVLNRRKGEKKKGSVYTEMGMFEVCKPVLTLSDCPHSSRFLLISFLERVDGSSSIPNFFRIMKRQFTETEWGVIKSVGNEWMQLDMFHRHWALKESFLKAVGVGIGFNLQRIEFNVSPLQLEVGKVYKETKMLLDGDKEEEWTFEETRLDDHHHVAVALGKQEGFGQKHSYVCSMEPNQPQFTVLTFEDLVASGIPIAPEDSTYWDNFSSKQESPMKQNSHLRSKCL